MNNFYNSPYGNSMPNYNAPVGPGYQQIDTNVIFVTGLEEALHLSNRRGSDKIYFHQDKDEFYRVKVDFEGRKTWFTFTYNAPNPNATTPVMRSDLDGILARLDALEKGRTEVSTDGQSNG